MTVSISFNNGADWKVLATDLVNTGSMAYTVPDTLAEQCLIKVADVSDGKPSDVSNAVFGIYPEIRVTLPNGGQSFQGTSVQNVGWTTNRFTGLVNVFYSIDNGANWVSLAINQAAKDTIAWTVPNTPSVQCLVKVVGVTAANLPTDQSDAVFTITLKPAEPPPPTTIDYCLSFDGVDDIVEIASSASLNVTNKGTIEFWMKTPNPGQKWSRLLEKGSWDEYYISFQATTSKICGAMRSVIPGGSAMTTTAGPSVTILAKDTWYHVAVTNDGSVVKLYINGKEESSKTIATAPRSLIYNLVLGAKINVTWGTIEFPYKGMMDELRIWNVARSKTDITNNMYKSLVGNETGLAAYWNFNEGSGQTLNDKTANVNHGRLGTTTGIDDNDPVWMLSNRPTSGVVQTSQLAKQTVEISAAPETFELGQNYPNPFNAGTTIVFDLPAQSDENSAATLEIYDVSGQLISTLWSGTAQPGRHQIYWNGMDSKGRLTASGVYFYRLRAGAFSDTKRMIMLK